MTVTIGRPDAALRGVDEAFEHFMIATAGLSDADAVAPSLLPGWSRAHVLGHVGCSGAADARTVGESIRGLIVDKYPGGDRERTGDIEAAAVRPVAELRTALVEAQQALVAAWARMPDDAWARTCRTPTEERTMTGVVLARRRELCVHLVDLGIGVTPADLSPSYLLEDASWLLRHRWAGTWAPYRDGLDA